MRGYSSDKRRHVLWLQWLLVVSVGYLLLADRFDQLLRLQFDQATTFGVRELLVTAYLLANLPLFLLPPHYFEKASLDYVLVFCDILFVSLAIYLTGQATSEFYLFFFLILIMAATGQNLRALLLGVLTISGLYTWMVYKLGQFSLSSGFLLRIPFLFIVGLFFGYLVYLQKQKEARIQAESEFTGDLFEFGKALSQAPDEDILYARIPRLIKTIMETEACELAIIEEGRIVKRTFQDSYERDFPYIDVSNSIHSKAFESDEIYSSVLLQEDPEFAGKEDLHVYSYPGYMGKSWKIHPTLSGVLAVYQQDEDGWTDHDLRKFQFLVDQAVLALQHRRLLRELESQARTDGLTGLANHRYFHDRMEEELSRARRKHQPVSVIMIDLDHFKRINDTFGHRVGDEILRALAALLKINTRRMDVAARYGGDEFAMILPETDSEQARFLCQRLLREVGQLQFEEVPEVSVSIGSATYPEHGETISRLIENADQALYHAKAQGRGRTYHYSQVPGLSPNPSSSE